MSEARSQRRLFEGSGANASARLRALPTLGFFLALGLAIASGCSGGDAECGTGDVRACDCQLANQVGAEQCIDGHWDTVCTCTPVLPGDTGGGAGGGAGGGGGLGDDAGMSGAGGGGGVADAG